MRNPLVIRAALLTATQLALATHQTRARRELKRVFKRIPLNRQTAQALLALLDLSADQDRPEILPLFPVGLFVKAALAVNAAACALEYKRLETAVRKVGFAESPWMRSVKAFLLREIVPAPAMEETLAAVETAVDAGLFPSYDGAYKQAYANAFTMVRESNGLILERVKQLIAKGLGAPAPGVTPSPADLRLDLEDLYAGLGLAPQDPWYSRLVVNNAMNRSWQQGRDSLSQNESGAPADWVWGYEWIHGDSAHPRPTHLAMNHHAAPKNDPVWQTFTPPPLAHNCSCSRYTVSWRDAESRGLTNKTIAPPVLTKEQLAKANLSPDAIADLQGKSVIDAVESPALRADRFPRSQFNIAQRPILNPSGAGGRNLSAEAQKILSGGATAQDLLNLKLGIPLPTLGE